MKREFVINRHGKDYVLYAGLLDEAHQQGLTGIKTELVQIPSAQNGNVAICVAEVTTEKGTFTGIGDADPTNVNRQVANALIRLAETRAKARALRDAVNVAMVSVEELPESAPELLLLDDRESPAGVRSLPAAAGPPAPIVSLASVRQQDGRVGRTIAETNGAPPPGAPAASAAPGAPMAPVAVADEPPRAPTVPTMPSPSGNPAGTGAAPGNRPATRPSAPSAAKAAPDGPPLPATPTQLETIAKLARSVGRTVATDGLSRAAASELITRLSEERYGARRAP